MKCLATCVHKSFQTVESAADWLTGSAGPFFIAICIALVATGIWTFFSTMFSQLAPPPLELDQLFRTHSPAHIALGLFSTIVNSFHQTPFDSIRFFFCLLACLFIIYSITWHYYMACTEPPGTVLDGLGDSAAERRTGPGSSVWWSRYRARAIQASGPRLAKLGAPPITVSASTLGAPPIPVSTSTLEFPRSAPRGRSSSSATFRASFSPPSSFDRSHVRSSSSSSSSSTPRLGKPPTLPLSVQDVDLDILLRSSPLMVLDDDEQDDDFYPNVGMCHKCTTIPLSKALLVLPPELRKVEKLLRTKPSLDPSQKTPVPVSTDLDGKHRMSIGLIGDHPQQYEDEEGEAEIRGWLGDQEAERLVPPPKPERAHHCRICKTCTLKFDHHCPWINSCVGLGNERYFVLFMAWLSLGCAIITLTGWPILLVALDFNTNWPYPYTPRLFVLLFWILALVMGFALVIMTVWQLWIIANGETSVETQDNAHYRKLASSRSQQFINVYDLGRRRNLELFFNVGNGSFYPWYTILLPIRVLPYTDGWHWAKRRGLNGRHAGVLRQEELTDDDGERDDDDTTDTPAAQK